MRLSVLARLIAFVLGSATLMCQAQLVPRITLIGVAPLWQPAEFRVSNMPSATNPFDPDVISVDASFTLPSGATRTIPAFWFQDYQRSLVGGNEVLAASGAPEWRFRFTPPEAGNYVVTLLIRTNGQLYPQSTSTNFTVAATPVPDRTGYVRVATNQQYFETGDGKALRLVGENVAWPGARGTYDYDTWFFLMHAAGAENYARMWMCPWWLGLETDVNSLTHYRMDRAWQLDYVMRLANQRGIYLLLCLDYHGMFEVTPDYWGGNNYWPNNPYNSANGGPCVNQNAFFTNAPARTIYQKRLRYLIARYGANPNLLAWQFLNEIDNVYAYLNPSDVAAWHSVMGGWLHTNDPFGHLVTTSLTGSSDRPEIWSVPQLDFADYHSYGEPGPATRLNTVAQSFRQRYGKPVLIDEFGSDSRGWNRANDPLLRGFRQGIWGGALGGSVGTSMSWWWENIHDENAYPVYAGLTSILNRTGWGRGTWTNLQFRTSGSAPPTVGDPIPGGQPFDIVLPLGGVWAAMPPGAIAVADSGANGYSASALNSFVHGIWHSDLKVPFRLDCWLTNNARLVMHLNSVSDGSILVVKSGSTELFRTNLVNLDGTYNVNNEYNVDLSVNLPAGHRSIEITNAGNDWFFLDWVRLERVLPATYSGSWLPSPDAIGLRGQRESLMYVIAPGASFPGSATITNLPLQHGQTVVLSNFPAGSFFAEWYDPATGARAGYTSAASTNGIIALPLPDFQVDLAGIIYPPPFFRSVSLATAGSVQFEFDSETGGAYQIEKSADLFSWTSVMTLTNSDGVSLLSFPTVGTNSWYFFRAKQFR